MLRNRPKLKYSGVTIILQNQSRFDKLSLLTATAGTLFNNYCLQPELNQMQCDIRLMEDKSPWLEGTKCIVLLGEAAMHHYCPKETGNNTLNEMRGSPLYVDGIPAIASYFPQDAADHKGHEQALNELSKDYNGDEGGEDDDDEGDVKRFSPTKRKNYAFWLQQDIKKVKYLLKNNLIKWPVEEQPTYKIYPPSDEVINILTNTKNQWMDFDIETDYEDANLLCFSFTFDNCTVYSVPILDYNYQWAYANIHYIMRALAISIRDNILVAHNGAGFDFFVLAYKYNIPIVRTFDTMLAMHRCYPDIEKSLGHCTSLWTWQMFHKDSDSRAYRTKEHMMQKLMYCAKDVFTMSLIRKNIQSFAKTIPGMEDSTKCAQNSIRPYLTTTMQGIAYSKSKLDEICKENDRLMMQYIRMINILIGEEGMREVRTAVKGKAKAFPGSNSQCVKYFHDMLGYAVAGRGKENAQGFRKPSLDKKNLYKLALKHDNPVITLSLLYRQVQKEFSSLRFIPWRNDKNEIINRDTYDQQQILL